MALREALSALLTESTAIAAIVGSKVYDGIAPPGTLDPYVTYDVFSPDEIPTFDGGTEPTRSTVVQLKGWARDAATRATLAAALRERMRGWRSYQDRFGVLVRRAYKRLDEPQEEPSDDGRPLPWLANVQRWEVWHTDTA